MMHPNTSLRMMVQSSLMAALIAVGAFIAIPIGPVPIVLQNMFVLLAGLLLGSRWGAAAVGVYLLAGICGLPVFAGGSGGIGTLLGPTGGYLMAYPLAAFMIGWISERTAHRLLPEILALVAGSAMIYALGVFWLKMLLGLSFPKALAVGMYPFLIGDVLKIAAAIPIARSLRPLLQGQFLRHPAGQNG